MAPEAATHRCPARHRPAPTTPGPNQLLPKSVSSASLRGPFASALWGSSGQKHGPFQFQAPASIPSLGPRDGAVCPQGLERCRFHLAHQSSQMSHRGPGGHRRGDQQEGGAFGPHRGTGLPLK